MQSFDHFVPPKSVKLLKCWIDELDAKVLVSRARRTKLGDFKVRNNRLVVSVNNNLNPYSFLITLTHELAHAFVFKKYKNRVAPHGRSWQLTFKSLMLNFLNPDCFPEDILKVLSNYMISPKASTFSDLELVEVLRRHDTFKLLQVSDILPGELFQLSNGKVFVKGQRIRKRYKCIEVATNKVYSFHPCVQIVKK